MKNFEHLNLGKEQQNPLEQLEQLEQLEPELSNRGRKLLKDLEESSSCDNFKTIIKKLEQQSGVILPESIVKLRWQQCLQRKRKHLEEQIHIYSHEGIRSDQNEDQIAEWGEELKETERLLEEFSGESPPAAS